MTLRPIARALVLVLLAAVLPTLAFGGLAAAQEDGAIPPGGAGIVADPSGGLLEGDVVTVRETGVLDSVPGAWAFAAQCGFPTTPPSELVCSPQISEVVNNFEADFAGEVSVVRTFEDRGVTYECDVTVKCVIAAIVMTPEFSLLSSTGVAIDFADAVTSAGCSVAPPSPGATRHEIATPDGLTRTYLRRIPAGYTGEPTPVVLNFHGFSSNAAQQQGLSEVRPVADANNFIVVHPEGTRTNGDSGPQFWNSDGGVGQVDDFGFVAALLDEVEADLCVDLDRVFAMGMSNGGFFSSGLACTMPERIAAIATVTGVLHLPGCNGVRNVPIVHMHGTADAIVGFAPIPAVVDLWAADANCDPEPQSASLGEATEHLVYSGCSGGGAVEFYVVAGGGHTWPGSVASQLAEPLLGFTTFDFNATQVAWDFFVDHPRPRTGEIA
jgi:polyhydroxybutyrate depolymerase